MDTRWLELGLLYGVFPVVFAIVVHRHGYRGAMAPLLWLITLAIGLLLRLDPAFEWGRLSAVPLDHPYVSAMLRRFVWLGAGLLALGRWLTPQGFLWLPRKRPLLWFGLFAGYTLLSAVPQGIIWRVFFVYRYASLFPDRLTLLAAGAAAFSLAHLAFWNWTAIAVTGVGGALFLSTYLNTGSMWLAALEHGAYGMIAFSSGIGVFLYRGAIRPQLPPAEPSPPVPTADSSGAS